MRYFLLFLALLFLSVLCKSSQAQKRSRSKPVQNISVDKIRTSIKDNFGSKVNVVTDTQPFYLLGDFNGDGFRDIAVLVNPEGAHEELLNNRVKYIDVEPSSRTNGKDLDLQSARFQYCYGVAIMHGTKKGWEVPDKGGKFLFYECFTPFRLVPKFTKIRNRYRSVKETPPKLLGDAIYLYLERDAASIVYWTGKTYKGYYQ